MGISTILPHAGETKGEESGQIPLLLYVEDEDAAVFLVRSALGDAKLNIRLQHVADGDQALRYLGLQGGPAGQRPALILLDLNLPRTSGREVLQSLQQSDDLKTIPAIIFSTSNRAADRNDCLALGARDYIVKPSSYEAFVGAVRHVCSYLPGAIEQV